jgi:hypothetical protein
MDVNVKQVVVVDQTELCRILDALLTENFNSSSPDSGDELLEDYFSSHFMEPTNDSYIRIYVNNKKHNYPSALDRHLPVLKQLFKLGDGEYEFFLVHVSW